MLGSSPVYQIVRGVSGFLGSGRLERQTPMGKSGQKGTLHFSNLSAASSIYCLDRTLGSRRVFEDEISVKSLAGRYFQFMSLPSFFYTCSHWPRMYLR